MKGLGRMRTMNRRLSRTAAVIFGSVAMALAVFIICIVIDILRIQLFRLIKTDALCKRLDSAFEKSKVKSEAQVSDTK